jgi:thioesterase domain-containing protein
MCGGAVIALEIANNLRQKGRHVAPLVLADPPAVPFGFARQHRRVDPKRPEVAEQLYRQVRGAFREHAASPYNEMPFDFNDANQLHKAILAGVGAVVASRTHVPRPYSGPATLIISADRAPKFFHPSMPWSRLLCGPRIVHVLPWGHNAMFRSGFDEAARVLRTMVEQGPALEAYANARAEPKLAAPSLHPPPQDEAELDRAPRALMT